METSKSNKINTLYSYDTVYSADSVEWCPFEPLQNVFVCANYQLNEKEESSPRKRFGRILLFTISPENGLKLQQTVNTAAVLDQKWCHCKIDNNAILGVVNAQKTIEIYKLDPNLIELQLVTSFTIIEDGKDETLILSLDWSTGKHHSQRPEIVCSDSKGNVHVFQLSGCNLVLKSSWHGHDFEAWIAGFYYWDPNVIFTGGDDSVLCKFDTRVGNSALVKNKSHQAGVTSFHSSSKKEYVISSGSYDENLRLWDLRNMKCASGELKLPGPLWRVKFDPFLNNFVLVAAMLGGIHIVDVENIAQLNVVGSYYEHKNIAYGADWSYLNKNSEFNNIEDADVIIGSCSFYDHLLCASMFNNKSE